MVDHLDDLESDFSVFHRVDNIYAMPARRFVQLAVRLPAYQGVMAFRAAEYAERGHAGRPAEHRGSDISEDIKTDPALAGLVDYGKG